MTIAHEKDIDCVHMVLVIYHDSDFDDFLRFRQISPDSERSFSITLLTSKSTNSSYEERPMNNKAINDIFIEISADGAGVRYPPKTQIYKETFLQANTLLAKAMEVEHQTRGQARTGENREAEDAAKIIAMPDTIRDNEAKSEAMAETIRTAELINNGRNKLISEQRRDNETREKAFADFRTLRLLKDHCPTVDSRYYVFFAWPSGIRSSMVVCETTLFSNMHKYIETNFGTPVCYQHITVEVWNLGQS
jgi:hypothetical protein